MAARQTRLRFFVLLGINRCSFYEPHRYGKVSIELLDNYWPLETRTRLGRNTCPLKA